MKESNTMTEYYKELSETLQEKNIKLLEEIQLLNEKLNEKTGNYSDEDTVELTEDEIKFRDNPVVLSITCRNNNKFYFYKSCLAFHVSPNCDPQKEKYAFFNAKSILIKRFGIKNGYNGNMFGWSEQKEAFYLIASELKNNYDIKEYLIVPSYYKTKIEYGYMIVSLNEFKSDFPEFTIKKIVNLFKDDEIKIGYIEIIDWEERKFLENLYKEYKSFDSDLGQSDYNNGPSLEQDLMRLSINNLYSKLAQIINKRKEN